MKFDTILTINIILLFISLRSTAQENNRTDSLLKVYQTQPNDTNKVKTLHMLLDTYMYNDIEKAKGYAVERLNLSKEINYKKGIASSLHTLGNYYYNVDHFDSAKALYTESYELYDKLNMAGGVRMAKQQLASVEYALGNYETAIDLLTKNLEQFGDSIGNPMQVVLDYQIRSMAYTGKGNYNIALIDNLKALKLLEELNDSLRMADALNSLGGIEAYLENFEKSLEYNFKALEIYKRKNDKVFQAQALNDIGNTYYYQREYEKAIPFLKQSVSLSNETQSINLESTALTNLGKSLAAIEQYDEALRVLKQGLILAQKGNNKKKISESLNQIGITLNMINRPQEAILYLKDAILLADSTGSIATQRTSYFNRSKSFADMGDFKKAYEDHQQYVTLHDSVFNITKSQQIEELRTLYDTEKKEQQIARQETEIALFEEKERVSELQKWLLVSGLGLSFLVFGFGFYGVRQKLKRNQLEKEKVDAELDFKRKELVAHALHLAKKNEVLENVKQKARELRTSETGQRGYQRLIQTINFDQQDDKNWENFTQHFQEVHKDFGKKITEKYPEITKNELRLMALLKMNLSSKEIASILSISTDGIKKARQRLRKKMELSPDESLESTVLSL